AVARAFVTEDAQVVLLLVNGKKKGEALNMIPMSMGEEQGDFHGGIVELGEQLAAERAQAGAAVENDDLVIGADLDARGVSAVANGGWAGCGDRAADAPKFQVSWGFAVGFMSQVLLNFFSSSARHDASFWRA